MSEVPERLRIDMTAEEVWKNLRVSGANTEYVAAAQGLLNLKLVDRFAGRLEGVGAGLSQVNQAIRDASRSSDELARRNRRLSILTSLTSVALLIATGVLAFTAWQQTNLLKQYTAATQKLTNIAAEQLNLQRTQLR